MMLLILLSQPLLFTLLPPSLLTMGVLSITSSVVGRGRSWT